MTPTPSNEELARQLAELRRARSRDRRNIRLVTIGAATLGVIMAAAVWSSGTAGTLSFNKTTGDSILASDFNDIAVAVNDNDTRIGALEASDVRTGTSSVSISTVGVLCGETSNQDGNVGGLASAKALCQAACASPTAHMCSGHEMSLSLQLGLASSADRVWVNGMSGGGNSGAQSISNCDAWTSADGANRVGHAVTKAGHPFLDACGRSQPVACCD